MAEQRNDKLRKLKEMRQNIAVMAMKKRHSNGQLSQGSSQSNSEMKNTPQKQRNQTNMQASLAGTINVSSPKAAFQNSQQERILPRSSTPSAQSYNTSKINLQMFQSPKNSFPIKVEQKQNLIQKPQQYVSQSITNPSELQQQPIGNQIDDKKNERTLSDQIPRNKQKQAQTTQAAPVMQVNQRDRQRVPIKAHDNARLGQNQPSLDQSSQLYQEISQYEAMSFRSEAGSIWDDTERVRVEMRKKRKENFDLNNQLLQANTLLQEKDFKIDLLEKRNDELQASIAQNQNQQQFLDQIQTELQRSKKQIENRDQEIILLRKEMQQLQKEKNSLKDSISTLQSEHQKFRNYAESRIQEFQLEQNQSIQNQQTQVHSQIRPLYSSNNIVNVQNTYSTNSDQRNKSFQDILNYQIHQVQYQESPSRVYQDQAIPIQNQTEIIESNEQDIPSQEVYSTQQDRGHEEFEQYELDKEWYTDFQIERQGQEKSQEKQKEIVSLAQQSLFDDVAEMDIFTQQFPSQVENEQQNDKKQYDQQIIKQEQFQEYKQQEEYKSIIEQQQLNAIETADQQVFLTEANPIDFFNMLQEDNIPNQNVNWFD